MGGRRCNLRDIRKGLRALFLLKAMECECLRRHGNCRHDQHQEADEWGEQGSLRPPATGHTHSRLEERVHRCPPFLTMRTGCPYTTVIVGVIPPFLSS